MRYPNGELIGDLNDGVFATSSRDLATVPALTNFDENDTFYDLLPVVVNRPPVISGSIVLESTPRIKDIDLSDGLGRELYVNRDGVVKIAKDTTITLRFKAKQPSVANVENGVLQVIPNDKKIKYIWRKDDVVLSSFTIASVRSRTVVSENELLIERIQVRHSGVYTCEAVNDIGTTTSEAITIEVVDVYEEPLLFNNLVENPYGKDGTQGWNSNNQNFTTKQFTNVSSIDLKTPHRVDLFGYNIDMMHPRPYQIDPGPIRGVDFYRDLTTDAGTYFTRTPYKYDLTDGEPMYVSAYQDIDLSDLTDHIKGGVFGINGIRAIFTCYIGNAITTYIPTKDNVSVTNRLSKSKYYSGAPRLSLENFLLAGPSAIWESGYVTIEEFEDETRLVSTLLGPNDESIPLTNTIAIKDPWDWNSVRSKYWDEGRQYYTEDVYQLQAGPSRGQSSFDVDLFTADELESREDRFTYGQFVKFNKVVIDKLNPKTNKIRIGIHFNNTIPHLTTTFGKLLQTGDPIDIPDWQKIHKKNTFDEEVFSYFNFINRAGEINPSWTGGLNLKNRPPREKYTYLQNPRPMVTGITLGLLPIIRQDIQRTVYETRTAFALNNLPAGFVPSVLTIRPFDPTGRLRRDVTVRFSHRSTFGESTLSAAEQISPSNLRDDFYQDTTFVESKLTIPSSPTTPAVVLSGSNIFPFSQNIGALYAANQDAEASTKAKKYGITVGNLFNNISLFENSALRVARTKLHQALNQLQLITNLDQNGSQQTFDFERQLWAAGYGRGATKAYDDELAEVFQGRWNKKARFVCHYVRNKYVPPPIGEAGSLGGGGVTVEGNVNDDIADTAIIEGNSYYVELDLTDSELPKSYIWRDPSLIGMQSASLQPDAGSIFGPFEMETGYNQDRTLYFKLPNEVVSSPLVSGGLELSRNIPISISLSASNLSAQNGNALSTLLSNPENFRLIVQNVGENVGRAIVANMWPDASMFAVTPVFTGSEAFNDYVEFNRRSTYDYLTQLPSGSTEIVVPYRFGAEAGLAGLFDSNANDRLRTDGSTAVTAGLLLERLEGLYGTSGARLYMKKPTFENTYILCTPGEYSETSQPNRKIVYASPTYNQLVTLIGSSTDFASNSFTINIERSFNPVTADPTGYAAISASLVTVGNVGVGTEYRGVSFNEFRFQSVSIDLLTAIPNTPSNVLVRNAASSLYAMEIAPYGPSPSAQNLQRVREGTSPLEVPLFSTQSVGTPVFALGNNNTYYYVRYSTILDQQVWFSRSVPNPGVGVTLPW